MNLFHQRTGGVDSHQMPLIGFLIDCGRHAMGAEYGHGPFRHLLEFVDENSPLGAQAIDDMLVVHDFMAHINRSAEFLNRRFDNADGAIDASTEPTRGSQ